MIWPIKLRKAQTKWKILPDDAKLDTYVFNMYVSKIPYRYKNFFGLDMWTFYANFTKKVPLTMITSYN